MGHYTEEDRKYVRYCIRYAVAVLGKEGVQNYLHHLDAKGNERPVVTWQNKEK